MNARSLTAALGGRWCGSYGLARCPAHDDRNPSLSIMDGEKDLLLKCHAGCEFQAIRSAVDALGHWSDEAGPLAAKLAKAANEPKASDFDRERHDAAARVWKASQPIAGTLAETYLRSRAITTPLPPCLRFHPALRHGPSGKDLPAMVAAVVDVNRQGRGVQRTFLDPSGRKAKVDSPKMSLGAIRGCAVRLGPPAPHVGICEGIETGLSVVQLYGMTAWATLGGHGDKLVLPDDVTRVTVFGDNGKAGRDIASSVAAAIHRSGRPVDLSFPPSEHSDFNDVLQSITRGFAA